MCMTVQGSQAGIEIQYKDRKTANAGNTHHVVAISSVELYGSFHFYFTVLVSGLAQHLLKTSVLVLLSWSW